MNKLYVVALTALILLALNVYADEEINQKLPSAPYGIWSWQQVPSINEYNIVIKREDKRWTAYVNGKKQKVKVEGNELKLLWSDGEYFVGNVSNPNSITGSWFQPPSDNGGYSFMATPVRFKARSGSQWSSTFSVQPRPFHLFLDIYDDDGTARAVFRNPERNDVFGASLFEVHYKSGDEVQLWELLAKRGSRELKVPFSFSAEEGITMKHPEIVGSVTLKNAENSELEKFLSRPLASKNVYEVPKDLGDGWSINNAVDLGFDRAALDSLVRELSNVEIRSSRPEMLHSLQVSYKGDLVMDEYFFGHSAQDVHDIRSLGKVFGSLLVGVAQQQGIDIGPSYAPLPEIFKFHGLKAPKHVADIELHHLMTYTSGLDTSEDESSPGSEDKLWEQKDDFWLYSAKLPKVHEPGKRYAYSSASANLVGAAIEQKTETPLRLFFHRHIAEPLQFADYHWILTPHGKSYLGGGMYLRPRDVLKLGAVYAANGKWKSNQIIPESWVTLSTKAHIPISPSTTGMSEEDFSQHYFGGSQAYNWRIDTISVGNKSYESYEATGNGGQVLIVVPAFELAVVMTGGNYRMGYVWGKWRQAIIGDKLLPALVNKTHN